MPKTKIELYRTHLTEFLEDGQPHAIKECVEYVQSKMEHPVSKQAIQNALCGMDQRLFDRTVRGYIQLIGIALPDNTSLPQWLEKRVRDEIYAFQERLRVVCTFNLLSVPDEEYEKLLAISGKARTFLNSVNEDALRFFESLQEDDSAENNPQEDDLPEDEAP